MQLGIYMVNREELKSNRIEMKICKGKEMDRERDADGHGKVRSGRLGTTSTGEHGKSQGVPESWVHGHWAQPGWALAIGNCTAHTFTMANPANRAAEPNSGSSAKEGWNRGPKGTPCAPSSMPHLRACSRPSGRSERAVVGALEVIAGGAFGWLAWGLF